MLHIHRAERADCLVHVLGELMADPLSDPFAAEVVAVPTRGMERWLTQRLSARLGVSPGRGDGVCANIEFPFPRRLVGAAVAAASGFDPEEDPWLPERALWTLLEVVEECLGESWLHGLSAYLGGGGPDADPARRAWRLSTVRHLAELYSRYAVHRSELVRAWADGKTDGGWQAQLWLRLRERIGQPSPAERVARACERLREEPELVRLPQRLWLFGLTRLPAGDLHVLRALAERRDVHVFLLHPSPMLWAAVAEATAVGPPIVRRAEDPTADLPANRLLESWGHDAREMQLVLDSGGEHADHHHPLEHESETLLARIQADVRADHQPPGAPLPGGGDERRLLDPGDLSLQVHSCHGRARQVEVVREAILHALREDPTLEPRDVIVMCPDIEAFAPLIQASFGAGELSGDDELPADVRPVDLRLRLADRALRQTNPILAVVAQLLELAGERLTASQVLDLADREPVRRRFRFDDDDLARVQRWIADSGIRWGLDAQHRAPFKLDNLEAGTWRKGLDRLLLGVAMTEDEQRLFAGVLPLDDVGSGDIYLAGRFAELVDRLRAALDSLGEPQTIDDWAAALAAAADALTATSERDEWQRSELARLLDDVVAEATAAGEVSPVAIALPELDALLGERLQGRPTRANFRTGHLTICTLVPMRSVPHRVVCLLGLDDGAFPRKAPRDGDDLMLDDPHVGERDPRSEDRQLLLDALLAATDRLIVTYTGNDERTNAPRPPAVPVGELLDIVDATVRVEDGRPAREVVVVRHPLQPFDPRNFATGRPWSFEPVTLEGARALSGPRAERGPFLAGPLPPVEESVVEVEDLVRFVQHPVRAFLRQRLGIGVGDFSNEVQDHLPAELDGLEKWGVGQRLLEARLAGVEGRAAILAEIARGTLPPAVLGQPVIDEVFPVVAAIVAAVDDLVPGGAAAESIDVRVPLRDGRRLSGTVPGVSGDVLRTVAYSRVGPKHRLAAWVKLLALTAARPERPFEAATIGRGGSGIAVARLRPLGSDTEALEQLAALVDLRDRGLREPLPLYCATSAAYAVAGLDAARKEWTSEFNRDREDRELEHELVLDGQRPFDELLAERPRTDEDWDPSQTSRFGALACRLWAGLRAFEEVA